MPNLDSGGAGALPVAYAWLRDEPGPKNVERYDIDSLHFISPSPRNHRSRQGEKATPPELNVFTLTNYV